MFLNLEAFYFHFCHLCDLLLDYDHLFHLRNTILIGLKGFWSTFPSWRATFVPVNVRPLSYRFYIFWVIFWARKGSVLQPSSRDWSWGHSVLALTNGGEGRWMHISKCSTPLHHHPRHYHQQPMTKVGFSYDNNKYRHLLKSFSRSCASVLCLKLISYPARKEKPSIFVVAPFKCSWCHSWIPSKDKQLSTLNTSNEMAEFQKVVDNYRHTHISTPISSPPPTSPSPAPPTLPPHLLVSDEDGYLHPTSGIDHELEHLLAENPGLFMTEQQYEQAAAEIAEEMTVHVPSPQRR